MTSMEEFLQLVVARNPGETEFHQAVREVVESVWPVIERTPRYQAGRILERMIEPERIVIFRVPWVDDRGDIRVNRGFRVEMSSALGPYKGGCASTPASTSASSSSSASSRCSRTASPRCRWAAARGGATSTPRGSPTAR